MPRPLRPIDDGLIYHVINRGNNRQDVFHKPADIQAFLTVLAALNNGNKLVIVFSALLEADGSRFHSGAVRHHRRCLSSRLVLISPD